MTNKSEYDIINSGDKMSEYYSLSKLLNVKDLDGEPPEIYMIDGNKTAGKTTAVLRYFINRWFNKKEQFMIVFRKVNELSGCANSIFQDVCANFWPDASYSSISQSRGLFHQLILNDEVCGYAVALSVAQKYKRFSPTFNNVQRMFFDEFQEEFNEYCDGELDKFFTLHTCVARGHGETNRHVPVFMASNAVSMLNPYYTQFGIASRLKEDTKFLRGHGWVLECCFNENASNALKSSGFAKAFAGTKTYDYATQNVYLRDSKVFIGKPDGKADYMFTLKYSDKYFGVAEYRDQAILYISSTYDAYYPIKYAVTTDDMQPNYLALTAMSGIISIMRTYFNAGLVRFENLQCKQAFLYAIGYR